MNMKVALVCTAGMSTSLVVEKMKKALREDEKGSVIKAIPMDNLENCINEFDVILLGPQIRYKKDEFERLGKKYNIPVAVINTMDYGLVNGEKILDTARSLFTK